jgi:hypothetical protein
VYSVAHLEQLQIIDTKNDCLERNLTWVNSPIHFDHVGHAYLALFQVVSFSFSPLIDDGLTASSHYRAHNGIKRWHVPTF